MNRSLNCADIMDQIPLYCYGEVSSEAEECIEAHLAVCTLCRAELAKHRSFLELLDHREPVAELPLTDCRASLRVAIQQQSKPAGRNWFENLGSFWHFHIPFRVPVGAMALVAVGFFAARYTPARFGGVQAGLVEPTFSNVRSVEPDASGQIRIAVDEVHRRMVSGSMQDPHIQELLLSGAHEESNPGVRVESIGLLKNSADSEEVRTALLDALTHDPVAGVRLKALEGLKLYAGNSAVRRTLANVLLRDENPGVRVQAIDLLTTHHDDSIVGVLQDVVQKEDNSYVRERTSKLLEDMKASIGTY